MLTGRQKKEATAKVRRVRKSVSFAADNSVLSPFLELLKDDEDDVVVEPVHDEIPEGDEGEGTEEEEEQGDLPYELIKQRTLENLQEEGGLVVAKHHGKDVILAGTVDALLESLTSKRFGAITMNYHNNTLNGK